MQYKSSVPAHCLLPTSLISTLPLAALLALAACKGESSAAEASAMTSKPAPPGDAESNAGGPAEPDASASAGPSLAAGPDPHSYSRPDQVRVVHLGLNWVVDFDAETLTGDAVLLLERSDPSAPLILDSRELDIKSVDAMKLELASEAGQDTPELALDAVRNASGWASTSWSVEAGDPGFGAPIQVELPDGANAVKLRYATRPGATGLQWLDPQQTAGKQAPFLYSQSQAIHARSWIPTQDSPGVRATWDAVVVVPSSSGSWPRPPRPTRARPATPWARRARARFAS